MKNTKTYGLTLLATLLLFCGIAEAAINPCVESPSCVPGTVVCAGTGDCPLPAPPEGAEVCTDSSSPTGCGLTYIYYREANTPDSSITFPDLLTLACPPEDGQITYRCKGPIDVPYTLEQPTWVAAEPKVEDGNMVTCYVGSVVATPQVPTGHTSEETNCFQPITLKVVTVKIITVDSRPDPCDSCDETASIDVKDGTNRDDQALNNKAKIGRIQDACIENGTYSYQQSYDEDPSGSSSGGGGCGPCGADYKTGGVQPLKRILLSRERFGDFGKFQSSIYDMRVYFKSFSGCSKATATVDGPKMFFPETLVDGLFGDTADGLFTDLQGDDLTLRLLMAGGTPTTDPALAETAEVITRDEETFTLEVIEIDGEYAARPIAYKDRNGYGYTITYEAAPADDAAKWKRTSVTDFTGRVTTFTYAPPHNDVYRINQAILPNGESIDYTYTDEYLTEVTYPDGSKMPFTWTEAGSMLTLDTHNQKGVNRQVKFEDGRLKTVTDDGELVYALYHSGDANEPTKRIAYQGDGRFAQIDGGTEIRYFESVTGPANLETAVYEDFSGTLEASFDAYDAGSIDDHANHMPEQLTSATGETFTYLYDAEGNVSEKAYADGSAEEWTYNSFRQITRQKDRLDRVNISTYDARGNQLTRTVGLLFDGTNDVTTAETAVYVMEYYPAGHANEFLKRYAFDANGNRTEFLYNADDLLVQIIEPDDGGIDYHVAKTFVYDAAKRMQSSTDAVGRTATYDYDLRSRPVKTTYHDTSTELVVYGTGDQANLVVKQKDRNGNVTQFGYDGKGRRILTITAYSTMDADGNNEVVNPASLQSVENCTYLEGTSLKESCTRDGDRVDYVYDYRHRLIETKRYPRSGVTLSDGRIYFDNLLFSTTDAYGRSTFYAYRASDSALIRTVKGTVPSFTLAGFSAVNALVRDLASNADYLISDSILDVAGQRIATVDARGIIHETDYDSRGRTTARREAAGSGVEAETFTIYDANSNVVRQTNARGFHSDSVYTRRNMVESRIVAVGTTVEATESFTYYDDRRAHTHTDARGNVSITEWHLCCGRLQARIDQAGHATASNTDFYGNVTHTASVQNYGGPGGTGNQSEHDLPDADTLQEVTTRFDSRHRPIARTVWLTPLGAVDANAVPIAGDVGFPVTDGLTTTYEYFDHALTTEPKLTALLAELTADGIDLDYLDNDGAAVLVTNPEGEVSVSITDGAGRSIASAMLDPISHAPVSWSTVQHDTVVATGANGTLLETTSTDALDHQNSSYSDGAGRTLESVDAEGNISLRDYDANGNVVFSRDANGVGQDCIFDDRNRDIACLDTFGDLTSRTYDANNNVVVMTDAKNETTTTAYDARDRRESSTDRINATTTYTYDDNSNLLEIMDAELKITKFVYDVRNLKTDTQYPDHVAGTSPGNADYGIEMCSFDALRRKTVCTDQLGDTVTCAFDMASRKLSRAYRLNGAGTDESSDVFTYDSASRLLTADKGRYSNQVVYTYDNIGRRETESLTTGGNTYTATHLYDAANRTTQCIYPDGTVVTKTYTDRNQLESISADASLVAQFGYDLGMREISRMHGNGNVTDSTYRLDNLKSSVTVEDSLSVAIPELGFTYGYDANKNVTFETTGGLMSGNSYNATYDDQDRLASWARTNAVDAQSWNLDLVGNWDGFTNNGTAQVRTYSNAHETDTIDGNALAHDAKGNLLTLTGSNGTLAWDIDNHLAQASDTGGVIADYEYDALGRRVAKIVSGNTTVFFSLAKSPSYGFTPGQVIAEYENGTLARTFVCGTYIDEPLAKIEGASTLYYHHNRKYDVAGLTDAAGNIAELYAYSPYGTQTVMDATGTDIGISAQNNTYGFTGRRLDEETGLWYFRARYFDSELGRFISRDPIGYVDGQNLYAGYFALHFKLDPSGFAAAESSCGPSCSSDPTNAHFCCPEGRNSATGNIQSPSASSTTTITSCSAAWAEILSIFATYRSNKPPISRFRDCDVGSSAILALIRANSQIAPFFTAALDRRGKFSGKMKKGMKGCKTCCYRFVFLHSVVTLTPNMRRCSGFPTRAVDYLYGVVMDQSVFINDWPLGIQDARPGNKKVDCKTGELI